MIKEIEHWNTADASFTYEFELDNLEDLKEVIDTINKRHSPKYMALKSPKIKILCNVIHTSILEYKLDVKSLPYERY